MRERPRSLALVALLLVSTLAGVVPTATAGGPPSGMVAVSETNINDIRPSGVATNVSEADLDGAVYVSGHASTTEVDLVTDAQADEIAKGASPSDVAQEAVCSSPAAGKNPQFDCSRDESMSLVISDDVHHDGRRVAVRAGVIKDAFGYVPEYLAIANNETGETWQSPVTVRDGWIVADVKHFSSNTVSFEGTVSIQATPAQDGDQFNYQLSDLDAVSNFSVELTGSTATEWDNESATGISANGGSMSVAVGGDLSPGGPSETDNPTLSVTGRTEWDNEFSTKSDEAAIIADSKTGIEVGFINPPETVTGISINTSRNDGGPYHVLAKVGELPDGTKNEGTVVHSESSSTDLMNVTFDQPVETNGQNLTLEFQTDGTNYVVSELDNSVNYELFNTRKSAFNVTVLGNPREVSATVDDGTTASFGNLSGGQTKTQELDISTSASSLSFDGSGMVDATLRMRERQRTESPTLNVNGDVIADYSGTLADSETVSFMPNESVIQSGTNTVNVTVGSSVGADAPTPEVDVAYQHDAKSTFSVDYSAEKLSVRYEVGRNFSSSQSDISMTIPFDNTVYGMRDVEKRVNGGSWTAVASSNYRITDANELVADIGSVSKGDTVEVRANGSRVETYNMSITVERATAKGNKLDSKLSIDSISENGHLRFASSGESKKIVYPMNESWDSADGYATIQSNGQQDLSLPNAPEGGTFRVQTIPVKATPNQGDVEVSVSEPRQEEPQFYVRPGDAPSDTVEFTYLNAKPDTKYLLYSKSNGVVRDSGTANSPVTLTDDDSAERLVFRVDDSGSSGPSNSDGWTDGFPPPGQFAKQSASGGNLPVVLLVSGLGIAVLWYARSRYRGASGVTGLFGRALSSNVVLGSLVVAVVGVGGAVGGVSLPPGAGLLLLVTGVPLATYLGLRRTGQYSHVAFGAVTAVALILGLQLLGGNVVSSVLSNLGPSMPIIAIGGLYVVYKAVKAYRRGKTVKLSVRGFRRGSSNDEDDKGGP
ncbi:hypothetical protein [Halorussus sp. MSC15.2]|uniref:hypothetical protein n=1 Tax=Halorussus sp. MSC15.2 TaxID=2283638 RepID=UPI0013D6F391|nr:hypothetical protein [Halorussus sp. MSC15.2]NEU56757.1 hypothetical protein [Halorussus sp. MSC15.2]